MVIPSLFFLFENAQDRNCGKKPEDFHGNLLYDGTNEIAKRPCRGVSAGSLCFLRFEMIDFYKSVKWEMKRKSILRRDGYLCRNCRRYGRTREATTVHHIKHLDEHPELALVDSNLISLCADCHNKAHPEKGGLRHGGQR